MAGPTGAIRTKNLQTPEDATARRPAALREAFIHEGYDGSQTWTDNIENQGESRQQGRRI